MHLSERSTRPSRVSFFLWKGLDRAMWIILSTKGEEVFTASLGFQVINTRGFNSTNPVRSLQIIDGVDNQAPGLNFSLGNFLGSSELDILKVDLVQGASSAFYGPNAFNGVISMVTKDPFLHQGLGASVKVGERNLLETAVRWAQAFKNKNDEEWFAYKLNHRVIDKTVPTQGLFQIQLLITKR